MNIECLVPNGKSGNWTVEEFTVTEQHASTHNIRAMFSPGARTIVPGTYKRLRRNGTVVMSNTPSEIHDHLGFIYRAETSTHVLINGLGLGIALSEILRRSDSLKTVTVVEISDDVIRLVGPSFNDDERVQIVHADAFEYAPPKGKRYDAVWHDIWDYICTDNLPEMHKLHRKYGRRTDWQGSWCRGLCERYAA